MLKDGTVNVKGRIAQKHDIEANWKKAKNFKPLKGEIIIYDMYDIIGNKVSNRVRHKIGDGIHYVNDLPFVDDKFIHILDNHDNTGTVLDGTDISTSPMDDLMRSGMVFIKLYSSTNGYPDEEDFELLSLYYFEYGNAAYQFRSNSTSLTIIDGSIEIYPIHQLEVDTNLTRSGYAADAKAVGDALKGYVKKGESDNETATVIGTGNATGDNSTVIGSGTAEGNGSVVFGNGTAFSDNSVAIGDSATAGCKGFYITGVEGKRTLLLSSKQGESAWGVDEEELLDEWQPGDEISYKNDTRYVLKSVIESVDTAAPSVTVKEDLPFDSLVVIGSPSYDEYSITNPRKPQAGIITFAKGAFTAGINNSAAGTASIALGQGNLSAGEWSYTEGHSNTAIGTCSHAEGYNTVAGNGYAHTEGYGTIATGNRAHAEGWETQATASASHAEGRDTEANGWYAHAEGGASKANGLRSHAQGHATQANATDSHAEGDSTIASSTSQHVQGKFNIADVKRNENGDMLDSEGNVVTNYRDAAPADKYAHIVGNGTDNKNRSNAHTVDWDGNAWYAGKVYTSENGESQYQLAPIKQSIDDSSVWSTMQTIKNTYPKTVVKTDSENKILDFNYDWEDCPVEFKTNADKVYLYNSENMLGFDETDIPTNGGTSTSGVIYTQTEVGKVHVKGTTSGDSYGQKIVGRVTLPPGKYRYWVDSPNSNVYGQLHRDVVGGSDPIVDTRNDTGEFTLTEETKVVARIRLKKVKVTLDIDVGFSITKGHESPNEFTKCEKTIIDVTNGYVEAKAFDGVNYAYVSPSDDSLEVTMYHNIQEVLNKARTARNILSGTSAPDNSLGQDGDIYIVYEE